MGTIIAVLVAAIVCAIAAGAVALDIQRRRHERAERKIKSEAEKNAKRAADIITETAKKKSDANSGNHSRDIDVMANGLREFSKRGKRGE